MEQNGSNQHENGQSLCSSHDNVTKDDAEFQQATSANSNDEAESRNSEKVPIAPTFALHQPCISDSLQDDAVMLV